jgi:transposase
METSMLNLSSLSGSAWAVLGLPLWKTQPGRPRAENRRVISGILQMLKTGEGQKDKPSEYGPGETIGNRYDRRARRGI